MQPTEIQVQRSLQALESEDPLDLGVPAAPRPDRDRDEVPAGLIELLADGPAIRLERLVDARMRLAGGDVPTDDDVADRLVGRLVCDRLR